MISSTLGRPLAAGLCALGAAWAPQPGQGQTFTPYGGGRYAHMEGEITPDSDARFAAFLDAHPDVVGVRLDSPGGTVVSAVEMAEEIERRRLSTFIAEAEVCASACVILFFAGHDRLVQGRLGVHQMDDGGRGSASSLQFVLARQLDAFQRFGVPWTVTRHMLTTPPWDMHWISPHDVEILALNRDQPGDAGERAAAGAPPRAGGARGARFAAFPAVRHLQGPPRLPDFEGRDAPHRLFRTRLSEGARAGVNFAGHYAVVEIGCGTSCRFADVVDLETGEVSSFPYGGEEQYQMRLLYSPDSRLVKARWTAPDDVGCIEQDLEFTGDDWVVLAERAVPKVRGFCDH